MLGRESGVSCFLDVGGYTFEGEEGEEEEEEEEEEVEEEERKGTNRTKRLQMGSKTLGRLSYD